MPRLPAKTADDVAGANEQEHHAAKKSPRAAPAAPAVLSQWNDADFLRAREAGDPRLVAALEQRAKNPQRTPAEAEMLESLLRPAVPARRPGKRGDAAADPPAAPKGVFHAVAAALGANQTAAARQTLAGLLAGDFPEAPAEAVAEDAAVALLRQDSAQSEQIVLDHLVAPPSADRQDAVAAAVSAYGSARLRRLLAQSVIDAAPPADHRQVLLALLCEPNPRNLEAQVLLYQSASADAAMRTALEKQFAAASTAALQALLGLAEGPAEAGPPPPIACYRVAGQLWGPPLTDFLDVQHRALGAMAERPAALVLALTIPNQALRSRLRRTLSRHWSEGPQALRAAGVPGTVLVEPGVPAVLKSLLRESQRARIAGVQGRRQVGLRPWRWAPQRPAAAARRTAQNAPRLPLGQADRGVGAGLLPALSHDGPGPRRLPGRQGRLRPGALRCAALPLKPGSVVREAYHVDWPGIHAGHLRQEADDADFLAALHVNSAHRPQTAADAWQLDYVRIEERTSASGSESYYRRQLTNCVVHSLPNGVWLDGLIEKSGEGGCKRSTW